MLTVVRIGRGRAAATLLDSAWDDLLARQPLPNPTLSATWLGEALRLGGAEPLVARAEVGGRVVAGAAMSLGRLGRRGGPRVAGWLGDGRPVISPDLLVDPDHPRAAAGVLEAVLRAAPALVLGPTPRDGPAGAAVRERLPWAREVPDSVEGWVLALPDPAIERRRRQVAYEVRRAEREGARVEVRTAARPGELRDALEDLIEVHRGRWEGRPGDDLSRFSSTEAQRTWHRAAVAATGARDGARIAIVAEDDRPVAGALVLMAAGGAMLHTIAGGPGGRLRGPGNVAILAVVEAATAAGATAIDLGRGGGAHKTRFRPEAVPYVRIEAARSRARQAGLDALQGLRRRGSARTRRAGARRAPGPSSA